MLGNQPVQAIYVPQPAPVRKMSHRPSFYLVPRNNKVAPRSIFTCIDEVYSSSPVPYVSYPKLQPTNLPFYSFRQKPVDNRITQNQNCRKCLLATIIIVIIICIIVIIVLLAVFLTR